jgi:hypothetical protein
MDDLRSIPAWAWPAAIGLLLIATGRLPYGYYTFLGFIICGICGFLAYVGRLDDTASRVWPVGLAGIAILFNPLIPIYLTRAT